MNLKTKFRYAMQITGLFVFLAFAPGLWSQSAELPDSIRVLTLKGPTGMGMFEILEKGYLELKDGKRIPVSVEIAGTPDIVDTRAIAGQSDFLTLPVNQAAKLYNKGAKIQLGGVNVWGVLYLLSTELAQGTPSQIWASLRGRTIYSTGKGASPDSVFRAMAKLNGLDPDKDFYLDYRYSQVQLAAMMLEKQITTAFLPEPFVSKVLSGSEKAQVILDMQAEWSAAWKGSRIAQGGIAVNGDFARKWPQVTQAFLDAYRDSCTHAVTAADAPERIAKLGLGIDAVSYRMAIKRMNLEFTQAAAACKDVETYLQVLFDHNPADVGGRLPDQAFYFK